MSRDADMQLWYEPTVDLCYKCVLWVGRVGIVGWLSAS